MITVRDSRLQRLECLTAVSRAAEVQAADEDIFRIRGIDANLAVVHRPIILSAIVQVETTRDYLPGLAFVI